MIKKVVHNLLYVQKWLLIEVQTSKNTWKFLGSNKENWYSFVFVGKNNVKIIRFVSCSTAGVQHLEDLLVLRWLRYGSSIQQGKGRDIIVLYLLYFWCSSAATRVLLHTVCLRLALLFLIAGSGSCSQNSATEATIYSMGWEVLKVFVTKQKGDYPP
jgi:hypothetical protein